MNVIYELNNAHVKALTQTTYGQADIEKLKVMLEADLAKQEHENATIYLNSDWSSASTATSDRLALAIKLLELGCKEVRPHQYGVHIGDAVVALRENRWLSLTSRKWYFYKTLEDLVQKLNDSKSITVKELMERKQQEQPTNNFWKDEAAVTAWLEKKRAA